MAGVRVNEAVVNLYCPRETSNWWALFRARGPASRFSVITATIPGDLVEVACEDREDAALFRDLLIEQGVPKTALKIVA